MKKIIERLREVIEGCLIDARDDMDIVADVFDSVVSSNNYLICTGVVYTPSITEVSSEEVASQIISELMRDGLLDTQYIDIVREDITHIMHDYYIFSIS